MNAVLAVPAHEAEMINRRSDEIGIVRKADGDLPEQAGLLPLWLKARAQTIGFRRDDLVRTHMRKVWRSIG